MGLKPIRKNKDVSIYNSHEVMAYYHSGDPVKVAEAKEVVIEMMSQYIHYLIEKKYGTFHGDKEDLYQICVCRILEDLDKYDPNKGSFTTWFQMSINNACSKYISSEYHHSTQYYANNAMKVRKAQEKFEAQGLQYTPADIVRETKLNRKNVDDALMLIEHIQREGTLSYEGDTNEASRERGIKSTEDEVFDDLKKKALYEAIDSLDDITKRIMYERYLSSDKQKSFKEIADLLGIKVNDVKKRETQAFFVLKRNPELKNQAKGDTVVNYMNGVNMTYRDNIITFDDMDSDEDFSTDLFDVVF